MKHLISQEIPSNSLSEIQEILRNKRIFITGGTGFFGKSILSVLKSFTDQYDLNLKITLLSRDPDDFKRKNPNLVQIPKLSFLKGDLLDFCFPSEIFDFVLHLAAPANATLNITSPLEMFDIVTTGTRRVLDMAVKCKAQKVLLTSSGAAYGTQPTEMTHIPEGYLGAPETNNLLSAYGEGKRYAELLGNLYSQKYGFEHKIARCFAFVGPFLDPHGTFAIGNFIRDAVKGNHIMVGGDGSPFRSYLYSDDLVFWLIKILAHGKNHIPYNVGSDQDLNILSLANEVQKVVNPKLEVRVAQSSDPQKKISRYVPKIDLARKELGLEAWTPLAPAIKLTAEYYKKIL